MNCDMNQLCSQLRWTQKQKIEALERELRIIKKEVKFFCDEFKNSHPSWLEREPVKRLYDINNAL